MAEIRIKFQDLESNLTILETQIKALEDFRMLCVNAVAHLEQTWTGEACSAYVEKMQTYTQEMKELQNKLQDTKKRLVSVKEFMETVDHQCADMISGL